MIQSKIYEYQRVNFLDAFRKMNFEFLEDEPSLLVEKIHSVDPEWIGHADYTAYGGRSQKDSQSASASASVPCLNGEWVVVCYSKETKRVIDNQVWYGSEWHKYYLCQVDFSEPHLFRMVKEFEHIYDAFQYLCDNQLVALKESDRKYQKQIPVQQANIALSVLTPMKHEKKTFSYDELQSLFTKHAETNTEVIEFLKKNNFIPDEKDEAYLNRIREMVYRKIRNLLPRQPFESIGYDKKLSVKEYLDMVRTFKENYLWNT